jgi:hypothetical protein
MALKIFIGQEVIKRIDNINRITLFNEIRDNLKTQGQEGTGKWIEISGLFSPANKIEILIDSVKSGNIKSLSDLNRNLREIHENYDKYTWEWCSELISRQFGIDPGNITPVNLIQIITDWKINAVKFNNMILKDAEKEFDSSSSLGFGIDGDDNTREMDFLSVRGSYKENKFVSDLQKEIIFIEEKADRLTGLIEKIQ